MGYTNVRCASETFDCEIGNFVKKVPGLVKRVARLFNDYHFGFFPVGISVNIRAGLGVDFQVCQLASDLHIAKAGLIGCQPGLLWEQACVCLVLKIFQTGRLDVD